MSATTDTIFFGRDDLSDREIWNRLRNGHKDALNYIFRRYVKMLYQYGYKFTADHKQIEDSIQEVFLTLWEKRDTLGETDRIKPYLFVIFRRKLIRALSSNNIIIDRNFEIQNYNFELTFSAEHHLIKGETEAVRKAKMAGYLSKLPKKKREVLYLRYYCDLEYDEIASVMDISYQSARNLMYKALKTLKSHFTSALFPLLITYFTFF
ncbi:sigma-70 family RNA polymerase sigma factor [Fulvivirgaceae bacterium BMA12]|uniref:Sigma-70 family RNA polymerase sigma factor n=1 Tax=Agaribacillus aureus TaxID=3051825 RepID=A0ABT8LAY6_9BACT|nr:sigma-70 family RNA polymerase sigma factor [Fulvivirgaceae bacterium BMA12]